MVNAVQKIEAAFKEATGAYNKGKPHLELCGNLSLLCLNKLEAEAKFSRFSDHVAHNLKTEYWVFETQAAIARPIARSLFVESPKEFLSLQKDAVGLLGNRKALDRNGVVLVGSYIYTALMAFAATIDLWKPGSRKSPGTYFEVLIAALMMLYLPEASFSKHVNLGNVLGEVDTSAEEEAAREATGTEEDDEESSVATDLVILSPSNEKAAVLPLKITTRERVVQPFAHQRILDSSFPDKYASFLCCISETQLDKKSKTVKQICVPGTVKLFQRHLARIKGLYYCDIPARYAQPDFTKDVPVKDFGEVFNDVRELLAPS